MVKKAYARVFLALLFIVGPVVGNSSADDLEQELGRVLRESKTVVIQAGLSLQAGKTPTAEITRLKRIADTVRATHLLMQERFRQREEKTATLGIKAVQRQNAVASAYGKAIDDYLYMIDFLPPDGSVSETALDALKILLDRIAPPKKRTLAGSLPYKHLGYPAHEPATTFTVVPAYKGGSSSVSPADTAASAEAPISEEIAALAQSLQWNPVLIYEWVKNNIETDWYWGVMKGAEETLHQKSGNDADQAALLTALLRASGFPTRYVRGTIEFFPDIEKVKNLTGITDPMQIAAFFQKAGIAFKPIIAGGKIANFQVEHVWVESQMPYSNYRGAVIDTMGKSWLGLDTSIKPAGYMRNTPQDVPASVTDTVRDDYLQGVRDKTPLEFLQGRVGDYLSASQPGKGWLDVLESRTLNPEVLKIIPASLQFKQIAIDGEYTELPADLRHQVRFGATSNGNELFTTTLDVMRLSNRRVVLTYEPETVEDQQIIDSFGGLDNTPSYLVRLRPVLEVDGERMVVAQDGLPMGAEYTITIDVVTPNGTATINNTHVAGNLAVIGVVGENAVTQLPISESDDAQAILFKEAIGYIDRWNKAEDELAAFFKVAIARPMPTVVTVGGVIDVTYILDIPQDFEWKGVFIDAALRGAEVVTQTADPGREREFMRLSSLQGSILENRLFEDDFKVDSVSTAKLLQVANVNGPSLVIIDRTNIDTVLPTLNLDDGITADIRNSVNQGLTVTIPQTEMTYLDWFGIGYVKENPETGESGWMLSGMVAGGMTAQNKQQWVNDDEAVIVGILGQPFSPIPNKKIIEADRILRIGAYQDGKAGYDLKYPLQVKVVDKSLRPIKGITVTFTVSAGGGTLKGVNGAGKTITAASSQVTVVTGYDGIARARLTLGQNTSESPLYVDAVPYSTMVGHNLVSVSALAGQRVVAAEKPFEGFAYPGDTVDLVKVAPDKTDNVQGHVNTYSAPVWVMPVDQFGNPVSNKIVTFTPGQPSSLYDPPLPTDMNAIFLGNSNACLGIATRECPNVTDNLQKLSDSSGAYAGVILGNTENTQYPITVTVKKDTVNSWLVRTETETVLSTTFNHYSYAVTGPKGSRAYLSISGILHMDENGNRIDAGKAGQQMTTPLETMLLLHEEIDPAKGIFATTSQKTGTVNYSVVAGGGSVSQGAVTEVTKAGTFATMLTPGATPGINKILAQGKATVKLRSGANESLSDSTGMTIWGVNVEVAPDQVIFVNKDGYPEVDTKLRFQIAPAEYKGYSKYLIFFEDGYYMGFVPANDGYALLSRGGAKFDITKKYSMQLVLNMQTKQEIKSEIVPVNVTMLCLIPDYDHNRTIDAKDRERALNQDVFYFWVNDDDGHGDTEGAGIPASGNRVSDHATVGGTRDLIDWFPVHLDLGEVMSKFNPASYTYMLKHEEGSLDYVSTGLEAAHSGDYLTGSNGGLEPALSLSGAPTVSVTPEAHALSEYLVQDIMDKKTVIMVEAWKATKKPLVLEISDLDGKTVFKSPLKLSIAGVEHMFRHKNLIEDISGPSQASVYYTGIEDRLSEPQNFPDTEANKTNFMFVHGYNVNSQDARGWHAEMFKRLYWSGSKSKFWGITWYGSDTKTPLGVTPDYHVNVIHAFDSAPFLKNFIMFNISGETIIAAHSLGNMVVSSMLSDNYNFWTANETSPDPNVPRIKRYFMIDAAVAIEAYDGSTDKSLDMLRTDWVNYKQSLWSSEWHQLFINDNPPDNRAKLTWRDRFKNRPDNTTYYNFYSSGEEILRTLPLNIPITKLLVEEAQQIGSYSWAIQEKLKGGNPIPIDIVGNSFGGWGFNGDDKEYYLTKLELYGYELPMPISPESANLIDDAVLRTKPFFKKGPDSDLFAPGATGSEYAKKNINLLLANALPALTLPVGGDFVPALGAEKKFNFDMQVNFKNDRNDWPANRAPYNNWKHSDLRDVAYSYISKLFDKIKELGGLDK